MDERFRTLGDMTRRDEMTNNVAEPTEIERIQAYLDHGLVGRFNLERELEFIKSQREMTADMRLYNYINDTEYATTMMTLSGRAMRLKCFQTEMFERYSGDVANNDLL